MIGDEWKNGKLELTNNIFRNLADAGVSVANPVPSRDVSGPDYTDAPWWFLTACCKHKNGSKNNNGKMPGFHDCKVIKNLHEKPWNPHYLIQTGCRIQ